MAELKNTLTIDDIEVSFEFDVTCEKCGTTLDVYEVDGNGRSKSPVLEVTPCAKCMSEAYDDGVEEAEES